MLRTSIDKTPCSIGSDIFPHGFVRRKQLAQLIEIDTLKMRTDSLVPLPGCQLSEEEVDQRGFSRSIGTDDSDTVTPLDDDA